MSNYKVEGGIHRPANGKKKSRSKYPFRSMKIGKHFYEDDYSKRPTIATAAAYFSSRNPEYKFTIFRHPTKSGFVVERIQP